MSEMTATRKGVSWRAATITVVAAALWLVAAWLLWRSTVPGDLEPPRSRSAQLLQPPRSPQRTARYERFVRIDLVLSLVATIVALAIFARRAPRFARNTGLGPIGAGLIVRHDHPDHPLGGRPPVLDRPPLVGRPPRPHEGIVGRMAGRTVGHARRLGRLRDAPDRGHHGLRPAVPAVLVAARDADLPRARGRLQHRYCRISTRAGSTSRATPRSGRRSRPSSVRRSSTCRSTSRR